MDLLEYRICDLKVKYMDMDRLFGNRVDEINKQGKRKAIDAANIYINFESLYNKFRRPNYNKYFEVMDKKELKRTYRQCIAEFINVAAHYRKYFTNHGIKTNIIYYYNEIEDDYAPYNNSGLCEDYRMHWFNSLHNPNRWAINNMVLDSIPYMKLICDYLENIYFISCKHVESSIVPFTFYMEGFFPSNMNLIVTSDEYDYNYAIYNFLVVTKYLSEPMLITKKNLIPFANWKMGKEYEPERNIHPRLFGFIMACLGNKKRSIYKVNRTGYRNIYKNLLKLYDAGYIFDEDEDTMHIQNLLHVLNNEDYRILTKEGIATDIMANFNVMDYEAQYKQLSKPQIKAMKNQLVDRTDTGALIDINERYFGEYPLRLLELNQYNKNHDQDNVLKEFIQ